jgi:uncharacterized protein (TIGR00725 family)
MGTYLIGVVGGSKNVSGEVFAQAKTVGLEIVTQGHLLVTGGEPLTQDNTVKDGAMDGSLDFTGRGGLVSLYPSKTLPIDSVLEPVLNYPHMQHLLLTTGMEPDARNLLTGGLPDALIVLPGGPGTCSECAYALQARKPVVFLNSWSQLLQLMMSANRPLQDVFGVIWKNPRELINATKAFLSGTAPFPSPTCVGRIDGSANASHLAVLTAIRMIEAQQSLPTSLQRILSQYSERAEVTTNAQNKYKALILKAADFDAQAQSLRDYVSTGYAANQTGQHR